MTVIAVLGIITGSFTLIGVIREAILLVQTAGSHGASSLVEALYQWPTWRMLAMALAGAGAIIGPLWIAASVGLLQLRAWGKNMAVGLLAGGIAIHLARLAGQMLVMHNEPFASLNIFKQERALLIPMIVIGALGGVAYCTVLLALLSRRIVVQTFLMAERQRQPYRRRARATWSARGH